MMCSTRADTAGESERRKRKGVDGMRWPIAMIMVLIIISTTGTSCLPYLAILADRKRDV